ncbi:MAG: ribonuclease HII [Thaumarchaeota archaeon]|nr:ribonuclease HII [Nitrososphaerota archaeon]|tara:strand:+ start:1273 stop:1923 length:651 start_codon:yes stop_codon:yes gene_type:complete
MIIAGIDEAGRGSVLGPIVVAGVTIERSKLKQLQSLGVMDSKKLTPKNRERLYREILKIVDNYYIHIVKPVDIDRSVVTRALNSLEATAMATVINRLRPQIAYVDSCDTNPTRFRKAILSTLKCKTEVDSRHHADSENVAVSAASILAKVRRDREIAKLRRIIGDIGSGYPSDKKTMEFVNRWIDIHKKAPRYVRSSWKPVRILLNKHSQKKLDDF